MSENNLSNIYLAGASDSDGEGADTDLIKASTMIVPKNSGVQVVMNNWYRLKIMAENFKSITRPNFIGMVKARLIGVTSLNSEQGNFFKAMSTRREAHMYAGLNAASKKPDAWDKIIYGDKLDNGSDFQGHGID